ncbi:hypothetical protein [Sphingomonas lenta]|uniref:Colicin transporter n=1 Tax=Sphingomonas lenta TaxID=1141887 RepID=A0A2A2SHE1_9SPHN|nr:hypothetical protein [Sphingomonas lenta]PAX08714.1 hypothetical protein CKY28_04940 [Sphingomonas lenta]
MMAAYRLRGLGWFASCAGIVLSFYLVSLQVAGERNKLEALNGRIRAAERDIRALETEFDTRANLQQLEKWNGDILALSAPVAGQFVADERQLASALYRVPAMPGGEGEMKTAALVVPSLPVAPEPMMETAKAPAGAGAVAHAVARAPVTSNGAVAAAAAPPAARPASARLQRVAMIDGNLLADLGARARAEASR